MNDGKYEVPHYILDLQRRASAQHDGANDFMRVIEIARHAAEDAARDERDSSRDRNRLRREEWQANLYGVITGCVGAFVAGWLLGFWL